MVWFKHESSFLGQTKIITTYNFTNFLNNATILIEDLDPHPFFFFGERTIYYGSNMIHPYRDVGQTKNNHYS